MVRLKGVTVIPLKCCPFLTLQTHCERKAGGLVVICASKFPEELTRWVGWDMGILMRTMM